MKIVMAGLKSFGVLLVVFVAGCKGSFIDVIGNNTEVSSELNGNVIVKGGVRGDILLNPGQGGALYINNYNIEDIIARVQSLPPVWTRETIHDSLGTFDAGKEFNISIPALDPEGGKLLYEVISGRLPPGIQLNKDTGNIHGVAPNYDATYSFSIRITDMHGKYADGSFSIDVRERELCSSNPCQNAGMCLDVPGGFSCKCAPLYGGKTCSVLCSVSRLGVGYENKTVPDAQMTAHFSFNGSKASDGRVGAPVGKTWVGEGLGSWLQIDLDETTKVNGLATQSVIPNYAVHQYTLKYSTDGNNFFDVKDSKTGAVMVYRGSADNTVQRRNIDPPVYARFIRFLPTDWHNRPDPKTHPEMRVELYGC